MHIHIPTPFLLFLLAWPIFAAAPKPSDAERATFWRAQAEETQTKAAHDVAAQKLQTAIAAMQKTCADGGADLILDPQTGEPACKAKEAPKTEPKK